MSNYIRNDIIRQLMANTNELYRLPLELHEVYSEYWNKKYGPDFHNHKHINSLVKASDRYLNNCKPGRDPLNMLESIEKWNYKHSSLNIDIQDFIKQARIAFAWHDVGIIAYDIDTNNAEFEKFNIYTHGEVNIGGNNFSAEQRSMDLFNKFIDTMDCENHQGRLHRDLISELIRLTEYKENVDDVPFALFVAVVDQLGNAAVNGDHGRLRGLINEWGVYKASKGIELTIKPADIVYFADRRAVTLMGSQADIVYEMFESELPELPDLGNRGNEDMHWKDAIEFLEAKGI